MSMSFILWLSITAIALAIFCIYFIYGKLYLKKEPAFHKLNFPSSAMNKIVEESINHNISSAINYVDNKATLTQPGMLFTFPLENKKSFMINIKAKIKSLRKLFRYTK